MSKVDNLCDLHKSPVIMDNEINGSAVLNVGVQICQINLSERN